MSMNIIDTICTTDLKTNAHLYVTLLNGLTNFKKYIDKIFVTEMSRKNNKLSTIFEQFKNGKYFILYCTYNNFIIV